MGARTAFISIPPAGVMKLRKGLSCHVCTNLVLRLTINAHPFSCFP